MLKVVDSFGNSEKKVCLQRGTELPIKIDFYRVFVLSRLLYKRKVSVTYARHIKSLECLNRYECFHQKYLRYTYIYLILLSKASLPLIEAMIMLR